ncbi:hypothetical protein SEVIR_4G110800v4 [Setaria viridis]|uniref:Uncharacterized protein n=1 Tax=Setaria viridis TaxID=4556 RepID=A0A4U6UZD1_SETVI|nr:hypothetical protein SEVIR_4G110800v2 [Setaria viridis]
MFPSFFVKRWNLSVPLEVRSSSALLALLAAMDLLSGRRCWCWRRRTPYLLLLFMLRWPILVHRPRDGSRRWLLRQFKALKLLMEEEDGPCLVPTIFAGGREFRGGPRDVLCFMFNTFPFRKKKSLAPV